MHLGDPPHPQVKSWFHPSFCELFFVKIGVYFEGSKTMTLLRCYHLLVIFIPVQPINYELTAYIQYIYE